MLNLNALFEKFLHDRLYQKNISPKTESYYRDTWNAYRRYTGSSQIDQARLNDWIVKMRQNGVRPVSCNTYISGLNAFCNWLFQNHHLPERLRLSKFKVRETRRKTISEESLRKIVHYQPRNPIELRIHTLILFLIDTGARINEAITLKRSNIDLNSRLMKIMGKGQKERVVPMSLVLRTILLRYLEQHDCELVFCSRDGEKMSYNNLLRDYARLCDLLEIERKGAFHALRHSFAYNYARSFGKLSGDSKNSLFHLQKQLGHSDLSTTRIYVDLQPEDLLEVHDQTSLLTKLST